MVASFFVWGLWAELSCLSIGIRVLSLCVTQAADVCLASPDPLPQTSASAECGAPLHTYVLPFPTLVTTDPSAGSGFQSFLLGVFHVLRAAWQIPPETLGWVPLCCRMTVEGLRKEAEAKAARTGPGQCLAHS